MKTIAVIDYGMGNLHSASKALEHVSDANTRVVVTPDADTILAADRVLFPGVGAIRDCMAEIRRLGVDEIVREVVRHKPVLAICVGMQALFERSEENGGVDCIGLLPGEVKFFGRELAEANGERLKVPHMGWNQVEQLREHPLCAGIDNLARFYFVHSYYVRAQQRESVVGNCHYGVDCDVMVADGHLFATQFHPEKSAAVGLKLLENFVNWRP
ncbi:imidazole glycerol phosphate synthase subunit HisH [Aestuariirhabdus litorea]|uniref:Imidazole glycerol phosphate synthase subunit HisH n=1 Tax=Aestuariirhabdus litorea TaxID=2528527 RepID=A0A3P3VI61_9GAMM|nr:imidazole glycerol phosphate synthase subunit HisH [Aestuariirhabdus litorea]RRJ82421.1 imidazole glycerol phosphate synthase subunit HisH [Aestuariirhabdus litorea]RWW92584.1 imidazole glycerol phosphate synthase subunit HisH [Endozoicomonadaceae bacterium GTF-13]